MAKYNTFVVIDIKKRTTLLVTSSARKAAEYLRTFGNRVEVWSENQKVETVYHRGRGAFRKYLEQERDYIQAKQAAAEQRNKQRRAHHGYTARPST